MIEPSASSALEGQRVAPRIAIRFAAGWPQMLLPVGTVPQIAIDFSVAPLPNVPAWFRGVMGRRGTMVPVFDVPAAYGATPSPLKASHIVVLDPDAAALAAVCCELPSVVSGTEISDLPPVDVPPEILPYLSRPLLVDGVALHEFAMRGWLAEFAPRLGE